MRSAPFTVAVSNVPGWHDPGPPVAGARADTPGILNLEFARDAAVAREFVSRCISLSRRAKGELGVSVSAEADWAADFIRSLPDRISMIVVAAGRAGNPAALRNLAGSRRCLLEVTSSREAAGARDAGFFALIAKGHEAAGFVGDESTFVLLQRLLSEHDMPVWARGGIGLHSAPACYAGGASGVVLDSQLLLTAESSIPRHVRNALSRPDGPETVCLGEDSGDLCRVIKRPASKGLCYFEALEARLTGADGRAQWRDEILSNANWGPQDNSIWPLGQDAIFGRRLAQDYENVAGVVNAVHESVRDHIRQVRNDHPLAPGSALAASHGTEYPILQGPMTRVSDNARFAHSVASGGGLPFLALALLRGAQVRALLEDTSRQLGSAPWGVGILGFVPAALRAEQLSVIEEFRPAFTIIAGGRPDQAKALEQKGIRTYLHVPTSALLRSFIEEGARRFIFEGRECGGHVGPSTSLVLWDSMAQELLAAIERGVPAHELHVIFAGGIHDARSAAMTSALAAPLAARGVRIGALIGTAYLFTREAVESGAIVEEFQQQALDCRQTVILHSGPGHATRCAKTPFYETFRAQRRELLASGRSTDEVKSALEDLNLGRLRVASKGLARRNEALVEVDRQDQLRDGLYMIGQVAALRDHVLAIRDLHEDVSAGSTLILRELAEPEDARPRTERAPFPQCDIAVVGMSCILPGAPNIEAFWSNVIAQHDAISEVPADRFDAGVWFNEDGKARDSIYSQAGGFVADVAFDPVRYGIPPKSLSFIDPLQLLMLVGVDEALRDAGFDRREFPRERSAVIFGFSGGLGELGVNYAVRSGLQHYADVPSELLDRLPEWTEDSFPGILPNVGPGRIANRFDLGGVNFNVDAACASSLAALYVATRELACGDSDVVIAGGIDSGQNPFGYLCFSKVQALSKRGRCKTFDQSADGIAISEGLSVVVLKRLEDAERDGDRVYAVVKGVAGSSDGRGRSLTAPRPEGQVLALRRAYERAGISPSTVGMIEAHGTGTVAGDASELASLLEVFKQAGSAPRSCAVGSVKSMVGHTKAAAGITGLIKAALALHHGVLPPTLNVTEPNRKLLDPGSPFYLNTETQPWPGNGVPRRAGVSSFGFGGSNFHAVLEEYREDIRQSTQHGLARRWPCELFVWGGQDGLDLAAVLHAAMPAVSGARDFTDLASAVCLSASGCLAKSKVRLAIVASSQAELLDRLAVAAKVLSAGRQNHRDPQGGIYIGSDTPGKVAFLFPGQGSQYPGMLRELAVRMPEFSRVLSLADRCLKPIEGSPFSRAIYPGSVFTGAEKDRLMRVLTDTDVAQPALGVVEAATSKLLRRFGVRPDMVAGHSYGEYVALYAAGALDEEALLRISYARGQAIRESVGDADAGAMAAISEEPSRVEPVLARFPELIVANYNGPQQTIIAGPTPPVLAAIGEFTNVGIDARRIPVACAFHTQLMAGAAERLAAALASIEFQPAQIPVFSNTLAQPYPESTLDGRNLLERHLLNPVRFSAEIEAMYEAGARVFVEAGPKSVLSGLVRSILRGKPVQVLPVDGGARGGFSHFVHLMAELAAIGIRLDFGELFAGRAKENLDLRVPRQDPPSPAWMLNPARIYRAGQKPAPQPRLKLTLAGDGDSAVASHAAASQPISAPALVPVNSVAPSGFIANDSVPSISGIAEAAVVQFQKVMGQFLDTQMTVMTAFLNACSPGSDARMPAVLSTVPAPLMAEARSMVSPPDAVAVVESRPAEGVSERVSTTAPTSVPARSLQPGPARDLGAELLHITAARTGYPPEVLGLDARIEADLGIDSIKKVEILAEFRSLFSPSEEEALRSVMDRLTGAQTLREIVERARTAIGHSASADLAPQPPAAPARNSDTVSPAPLDSVLSDTPQFRLAAVDAAPAHKRAADHRGRIVLITDDETGLACDLASELHDLKERPVLLRDGSGGPVSTEGVYCTDLSDAESVGEAIRQIRAAYGPIGAIVHLLPLREKAAWRNADVDAWQRRIRLDVKSLYAIVRTCESDLRQRGKTEGALVTAVTGRGGSFGIEPSYTTDPGHFAVADFIKTVALELDNVRCRVVDIDLADGRAILRRKIVDELTSDDDTLQIGCPGDRRLTVLPRFLPQRTHIRNRLIDSSWVVLLTGGARGITAEIAKALAAQYRPRLILAGLSPFPGEEPADTVSLSDPSAIRGALLERLRAGGAVKPSQIEAAYQRLMRDREIRANLSQLANSGAQVEYHSVDVRDESAFGQLIDDIYTRHGSIDAVVHGTGIIEDKLIRDKTPASFDRVLETKSDSAFILLRKLRLDGLKSLVFMSSISAALGNRGQADYAAANGVLNGIATALASERPGIAVALNWGPWDSPGMVSPHVRDQFLTSGVQLVSVAAGVKIVLDTIEAGGSCPVVVVGDGPWSATALAANVAAAIGSPV